MKTYLGVSEVIDWDDPAVLGLAQALARGCSDGVAIAASCFEWVRDEIRHSVDYQMNPVTCRASDVLAHKTGYCFAKSHLLAALLRANGIPAGFCYQRLSIDDQGAPFCLHGFNALYLPEFGWYRVDARGNREGINAQFNPPYEQLAYTPRMAGEADCPEIFAEPLAVVLNTLQACQQWQEVLVNLPDRVFYSSGHFA
jgi:transglutaminase-like putative cysteine protease